MLFLYDLLEVGFDYIDKGFFATKTIFLAFVFLMLHCLLHVDSHNLDQSENVDIYLR